LIHVYALVDADAELPDAEGVDGEPVTRRSIGGLGVVLGTIARRPDTNEETALRHGAVVAALADATDAVLPARFGTWFSGEQSLAHEIEAQAADLRRSLDQVRGCAEMGVRATGPRKSAAASPPASTGREYLHARLAEMQEDERLVELVHRPLSELARASVRRSAPGSVELETAYLVEWAMLPHFRQAVDRLASRRAEVSIRTTGPWPPYSFAGKVPEQ
jgi:hypothetical protein